MQYTHHSLLHRAVNTLMHTLTCACVDFGNSINDDTFLLNQALANLWRW